MNLKVIHPEQASLEVLHSVIQDGDEIYRSPHVGNVNRHELSLAMGISMLGGTLQMELVDTIQGDDRYSNPRVAMIGDVDLTLVSRRYARNRIVGGCLIEPNTIDELLVHGVKLSEAPRSLKELHAITLRQALPESVSIMPSSRRFSLLGTDVYGLVLQETAQIINRPMRRVSVDGKLETVHEVREVDSIYGLGADESVGLLPPLEAMMAIEVIQKVLSNNGNDCQIVHIGGPDMVKYTKDRQIMEPTTQIVRRVLCELGIANSTQVDYIVPCMKTVLMDEKFVPTVDDTVRSQYDILTQDSMSRSAVC
jgi:hypothetical protein